MTRWLAPLALASLAGCGGGGGSPDAFAGIDAPSADDASVAPDAWRGVDAGGGDAWAADDAAGGDAGLDGFVTPADPRLAPAMRDFGSVVSGFTTAPVTFTLSNRGGAPLVVDTVAITGPNAGDFVIAAGPCSGATLHGAGSCTIDVVFAPVGPRGACAASLDVTAGASVVSAALMGTTFPDETRVLLSPVSHDFGGVTVATTSAAVRFQGQNPGGSSLRVDAISIVGTDPGDFVIVPGADTCTGATLTAGGTCTLDVAFAPTATGARDATLVATSTPGVGGGSASLAGIGL